MWALAGGAGILAVVLFAGGCQGENSDQPAGTQPAKAMPLASPTAHSYAMRGVVTELPEPGGKDRSLMVRHEPVPTFVGVSGDVIGMDSMTMPFELAPGVKFDDIHVGDKIAFTLVMDWKKNSAQITALHKLPADTALNFSATTGPAARGAMGSMGSMSMPAAAPATEPAPATTQH
jgi:hypothetical protein